MKKFLQRFRRRRNSREPLYSPRNAMPSEQQTEQQKEPVSTRPTDRAKRHHNHRRPSEASTSDPFPDVGRVENVIEDGICTQWYQPAFRGAIFASPGDASALSPGHSEGKGIKASAEERARANEAFNNLRSQASSYSERSRGLYPTRLIDIRTGQLVQGTEQTLYVIGSYVCYPENLPLYPRNQRRNEPNYEGPDFTRDYSTDEWEYTTSSFDEVVNAVKVAELDSANFTPKFWIIDDTASLDNVASMFPAPSLSGSYVQTHREYLTEVYYYLAAEAHLMGLQFVWLDCLCISQQDPDDLAKEIPRMTEYYRGASRCVVVSEMLRRRYSHTIDHLGFDFLDATFDSQLPSSCLTEDHRSKYGLEDEVLGWLVGFHQLRVWVFQETFLSKDVVHRGGNIRLNTRDIMTYGIRSVPDQSGKHVRTSGETDHPCRKIHQRRLPLCSVPVGRPSKFTPNHCLSLIQRQGRNTLRECDYIFSVLGLFEPAVRRLFPVSYDIPLATLSVLLIYARVFAGDALALFFDENEDPDAPSSLIDNAPLWLPRKTVHMFYQSDPVTEAIGSLDSGFVSLIVSQTGEIFLVAPFYGIKSIGRATLHDIEESRTQESVAASDGSDGKVDWVESYQDVGNKDYKDVEIEEDDIILDLAVRPDLTVSLYVKPRRTDGERAALEYLKSATAWDKAALVCVQTSKPAHFWMVLAAFGRTGETWRIVGHLETSHIHGGMSYRGENAPLKAEFRLP